MNMPSSPPSLHTLKAVTRDDFPQTFAWGVATASFQIEGAARSDGRGPSIWDTFCAQPGNIADGSNGDVACNHYHLYQQDLDIMQRLGVEAYRFSMAWPRIQPDGVGAFNPKGLDFYERIIDGALARGIKPYATLFHWDLPQALQDGGGWNNRDVCQRFADYAHEVARRFGDRLSAIATHNEPWVMAFLGHEQGIFAPGIKSRKIAVQVAHHLLLSHGMALDAMRATGTRAQLGIVLNQSPIYPDTTAEADIDRARHDDGMIVRWYMDALLKGEYPADILDDLADAAPVVLPGDMAVIARPIDFIGINYYTRQLASAQGPYNPKERGLPVTDMDWEIYPLGITELLLRLHRDYKLPALYITENGAAFRDELVAGQVDDRDRVRYLQEHIAAVQLAIAQGVDVRGYFVWSLLDNFEWASGYAKRFGIVYVDYATQTRHPKRSAEWYRSFLARG